MKSIKYKALDFAFLATLIPSLALGLVSYFHNKDAIRERAAQQLHVVADFASREIDLWLQERVYDLRVFASSYVLLQNLPQLAASDASADKVGRRPQQAGRAAAQNLTVYLRSIQERFDRCRQLMLVQQDARVIAASGAPSIPLRLPPNWLESATKSGFVAGPPYWEEQDKHAVFILAVPIILKGVFSGALAAEIELDAHRPRLAAIVDAPEDEIVLVGPDGHVVLSSRVSPSKAQSPERSAGINLAIFRGGNTPAEYKNYDGRSVLGVMNRPQVLSVAVVAEKDTTFLYARLTDLRNLFIVLVCVLLILVGISAYVFGMSIVRPLRRLMDGARDVTSGDLEVQLAVSDDNELGDLTGLFNQMVVHLRNNREEIASANRMLSEKNSMLEELSRTDSLTGLHNRENLIETMGTYFERYKRNRAPFSILMLDLDHFKLINDTYGHVAGDAMLVEVARIITQSIRTVDYAARYGGEEFLVILFETPSSTAAIAADRIRLEVAERFIDIDGHHVSVTVSIGVAEVRESDTDAVSIINRADGALYQAKAQGRNRVICA